MVRYISRKGSDRLTAGTIATAVGKSVPTVQRRRRRYMAKAVDGLLKDATPPSRVNPLMPEKIKQVVHMTLHERPPNATQWSVRSLAKAAGISYTSVQRIWHAHGLKPHLYLNPSGQGAGPLRRRKSSAWLQTPRRASSRRFSLLMQVATPHQALGDVGRLQRRAFGW